jgi:hypothetical protein
MRRQSATPLTCEQRQIGVLETETSVPLVLWCPRYPVIAQTMAEIMAKIDLRDLDIDPKVPARKGYGSPQLQQHEPFLVIEGAVRRTARRLRRMARGLGQGPMAGAAAMTLLRSRKCQVPA